MSIFMRTLKYFTRREKAVAFILLLILLISGKQIFTSPGGGGGLSQAKVYTEGLVGEIKHLNPVFTEFSEADRDISSLIFSGLARYNGATGVFEEDLATHTLSEDQLTYTFTLKNDVLWHDGTEMTADDIYFTFVEVIQAPDFGNPILKANFDGVKIEQIDSRTLTFTLNSKNSFFFSALTVGILPSHILAEVPVAELDIDAFNKLPIGSGPYRVSESYEILPDSVTSVNLELFDEYYAALPNVEKIKFIAYPSITDLIANRSTWNSAARIPNFLLSEIDLEDLVTHQYELPQYTALFFNTDSEKMSKNKTRLGISKAINKDDILTAIDYKVQIDTPLLELEQEEWIHTPDPDEASGALFDAGWPLDEDDEFRKNSDGETLTLKLVRRDFSNTSEPQEITADLTARTIQNQLKEVGVEVVIAVYELEELQTALLERDYDMLLYGQSLGYNLDIFSYWHSSQATEIGLNLSNYQNPKADFNIESIRESFDAEERSDLLTNLAEIISSDIPAIFLYTPSYYYLVDTKLTGVEIENILLPLDRFSNIEAWTFN
ncbi:hypothetical protein HOH67_03550 [Candidatus Peregrinibacteria bacterium]|nr:hypothetical protein [Candidatus Peregrinibacteria bacterium]